MAQAKAYAKSSGQDVSYGKKKKKMTKRKSY